ncbi:YcdB/YcdC domain-containing protein [Peribacillus butanolivorans]|uniref:YcdB/YcdC domain-containing protein n=1 Tax=Peribacillus butanolivorans TaxID=421767 RepID=UPI0036D7665A
MNKNSLKQKAIEIGKVHSGYTLEIEDFHKKSGTLMFAWKSACGDKEIIVELDVFGNLLDFHLDKESVSKVVLAEKSLHERALQYVMVYYPEAKDNFILEKISVNNDKKSMQFTYVQQQLNLPLPRTGFFVETALDGEVIHFHYYGAAKEITLPENLLAKELVMEKCLKDLDMKLSIAMINSDVHENGKDLPRLVYEPVLPFYSHPADPSSVMKRDEQEDENEEDSLLLPLPQQEMPLPDINKAIGFELDAYTKVREVDLGDELVTVWRQGEPPEVQDLSVDSYFITQNDQAFKIKTNKETGMVSSFANFEDTRGPLSLSITECKRIASQFLYKLYPDANRYFYINEVISDTENHKVAFHFTLIYEGIPFGLAYLSVNETTGNIDSFFGPDLDPLTLSQLQTLPAISPEQARKRFISAFELELLWDNNYKENSDEYYELVYKQSSRRISYIDAQTGEIIWSKLH